MSFKTYLRYTTVFVVLLFISCAPSMHKSLKNSGAIVFPIPPDTPKIQYLTSISSSSDVGKKQSSFEKSIIGENKRLSIIKPYGQFIRNGKIYVCDVSVGGLEIIDLEAKKFNYFIPKGRYSIKLPLNCYVDENNLLYITDVTQQKIMVFDSEGDYVTSFGKKENKKPTDVFIYKGKIYVPDAGNNRVNVYNEDTYQFEDYFPKSAKSNDDFLYLPTNIVVKKDKIYVSDMGNGNVKVFDIKMKYLNTVGTYGKNIGQFVRPKGVAVDSDENLYVVDASFENVQIFDKEGKLLMFFGGAFDKENQGEMWLPTKVTIDYDNLKYFEQYVDPKYKLKYLILVVNQFGPQKINVYGRIEPVKVSAKNVKNSPVKNE